MAGASMTIWSLMPVSCSILKGMGTWGFTNSEKRETIFPSSTRTAPISIILFFTEEKPVVSMSKTT